MRTTQDREVIHPSAIVHPRAVLEEGAIVGPYCIVEANVHIGARTELKAYSQVLSGTRIGRENVIGPSVILGGEPMDLKFCGEESFLEIGDHNRIREFSSIHRATGEGLSTRIGNHNFVMAHVHITHNCVIGNRNVIANAVQFAGHVVVEDFVTVGGMSGFHQFCRIGSYAMIGGLSRVLRDILPYSLVDGRPARHYGLNRLGLKRRGIEGEEYELLAEVMRRLRRNEGLEDYRGSNSLHLKHLLEFIAQPSARGCSAFVR